MEIIKNEKKNTTDGVVPKSNPKNRGKIDTPSITMTTDFSVLAQTFQNKVAGLTSFMDPYLMSQGNGAVMLK